MVGHKNSSVSTRPWLVACNQVGASGESHYGFGTLWMPYDRRGDFSGSVEAMRAKSGCSEEFEWKDIRRGSSYRFSQLLVDHFFATQWLAFHCLVVERAVVNLSCHADDFDLAQRKHFTMLLANKIGAVIRKRGAGQEFRVWVSPIPSRYEKAAEAVEVISGNIVAELSRRRPSITVTTRSSTQTPAIQLCDLLLGAVVGAWNRDQSNGEKVLLEKQIAGHIGWPDLRSDTRKTKRKFNIWKFHDPLREPVRSATTRPTTTT
jgi:hypothetical protein